MTCLAIVPARGNSKSIPRKNLAPVCGKPLLWYTLDCAKRAKHIDRLIVSTEDDEIAAVAEAEGVCVERRPDSLCGDKSDPLAVMKWHMNQQDVPYRSVMLLQPTCPLTTPWDIDGAICLMESERCSCVISVRATGDDHPARMYTVDADGRLQSLMPEHERTVKQELPVVLHRSGDIYLLSREAVNIGKFHDRLPWVIGDERHCNVDGPLDLVWARKRISMLTGAST